MLEIELRERVDVGVAPGGDVVPDALAQVSKYKEEEANRLYEFDKNEDIPNL